jgi:pimeloyl-ACP methyl ester carboxylesterase
MFRDLIPQLSDRFHVIAPDYPGFGYSDAPPINQFEYTFDNLTKVVDTFLEQQNIGKYILYMQDYGGPVGFRIAAKHPERVSGLIVQNTNAYTEGISAAPTMANLTA